jgi:asparagine synthase (glutamine-hydrolysing)
MSVQFGRWNFEGQPPAPDYIEKVSAALATYGPDSNESYSNDSIQILYRAFNTTKESRREKQPYISPSGAVITWDGRLDNRADLISGLRDSLTFNSTDMAIVGASYEKWGTDCLGKLIGDWALSIWNPRERSVLLAKDPIGTKHLYYSFDGKQLTWSTILDPLVLFVGRTLEICEEYIAGWFYHHYPATHLTPYVGIHSVPPSSSVLLQPGKHTISRYWDFDPYKRIRYSKDAEYEEHFRTVFAKAVRRRLRSERPVLAELSGGMDSSSIVCMADAIIARGAAETARLDTVSWYDDSDSSQNMEPFYFKQVEEQRGRLGHHINLNVKQQREQKDVHSPKNISHEFQSGGLVVTPDSNRICPDIFEDYIAYVRAREYRVTLSGIAGEYATAGFVPTPRPELQNLLAKARFFTLAHQLKAWAAKMNKPRLPLLLEAARGFFVPCLSDASEDVHPAAWFDSGFLKRHRAALLGYPCKVKLLGSLPSFQNHIHGLSRLRRAMATYFGAHQLHLGLLREIRYPYLDRDMLEFAYAIPQEQLVGVGKRRFLMKRALVGIVPDEILNRKPKKAVTDEPRKDVCAEWPSLTELGQQIISASLGIIHPNRFLQALQQARQNNNDVDVDSLKRTLLLEFWLRHLIVQRVLPNSIAIKRQQYFPLPEAQEPKARTFQFKNSSQRCCTHPLQERR